MAHSRARDSFFIGGQYTRLGQLAAQGLYLGQSKSSFYYVLNRHDRLCARRHWAGFWVMSRFASRHGRACGGDLRSGGNVWHFHGVFYGSIVLVLAPAV